MKAIPALALFAATFAFLILPLRIEIAASILAAAGLMAVAMSDYSRATRRLRVPLEAAPARERGGRFVFCDSDDGVHRNPQREQSSEAWGMSCLLRAACDDAPPDQVEGLIYLDRG